MMSEYIEMIKDEIDLIDEKLEKIEAQLENDVLKDYEVKLLQEEHIAYNVILTNCEKVVRDARRKARKSNQTNTMGYKQ